MTSRARITVLWILLASATPVYAAEGGSLPRIANFAIVAAALYFALRKPVADYLQARTDQIRAGLADAKEKIANAQEEHDRAKSVRESLDDEVEKAKQEARVATEAERQRILKTAEIEAERIRELARKEIANEVETGRRRLLARATELSVSLAHKKLEATMTEDDQTRLIDRSIEILENPKS